MLSNVKVIYHSCVKFSRENVIYIDPFEVKNDYKDADIIFITHSHYDHFSEEDIKKVKKEDTKIVITQDLYEKTINLGFETENIVTVKPNANYELGKIKFYTIPAYNINKQFHPKENNWVGYLININERVYYIAGDTDITDENKNVKCDVAFVPIGGTYTMDAIEAASLVNIIKPEIAVPIHYNSIVGTKEDEKIFKENLSKEINCQILL